MKKNKITTFNFDEYFVDVVDEIERSSDETVRFYLYKKGLHKMFMFGLLKRDVDNMQEGELEETVACNIPQYIGAYEEEL